MKIEANINSDLTKEEMRIQQEIRNRTSEETISANWVEIEYQKITIEEHIWKSNEDKHIMEEIPKSYQNTVPQTDKRNKERQRR